MHSLGPSGCRHRLNASTSPKSGAWISNSLTSNDFPSLRLARESLEEGGAAPAVLNAANEIAVASFLERRLAFPDIARLVEDALQENDRNAPQSIEDVFEIDRDVRRSVTMHIEERCA